MKVLGDGSNCFPFLKLLAKLPIKKYWKHVLNWNKVCSTKIARKGKYLLSYIIYLDFDFTHFVSEHETSIENWLETVQRYGTEGMTTRELYDFRWQTNLFSTEDIGMIVNRSVMVEHLHPPNGMTAIVVNDAVQYSLAKIYALQTRNHEKLPDVKVFFALGEAIAWLGDDVSKCL